MLYVRQYNLRYPDFTDSKEFVSNRQESRNIFEEGDVKKIKTDVYPIALKVKFEGSRDPVLFPQIWHWFSFKNNHSSSCKA